MSNIELKPCPFCGGEAYLEEYSPKEIPALRNTRYHKAHKIGCKSCQIYFLEMSICTVNNGNLEFIENGLEKCLNKWNRRAKNKSNRQSCKTCKHYTPDPNYRDGDMGNCRYLEKIWEKPFYVNQARAECDHYQVAERSAENGNGK